MKTWKLKTENWKLKTWKLKTENLKLETQKISISEEALSQEVNGETVILDLQSESYFGLDEVGTRIWQLLQEEKDLQKVFDALLQEYDVEAEQLEQYLIELVDKLIEAGLAADSNKVWGIMTVK